MAAATVFVYGRHICQFVRLTVLHTVPDFRSFKHQLLLILPLCVCLCVFLQALGNHEFDNGVQGLIKPFLQKVNCTVLSANIKPDSTLAADISGLYFASKIFTINSEKVGVVGYTSKETPALSLPGTLIFTDSLIYHVGTGVQIWVYLLRKVAERFKVPLLSSVDVYTYKV